MEHIETPKVPMFQPLDVSPGKCAVRVTETELTALTKEAKKDTGAIHNCAQIIMFCMIIQNMIEHDSLL